MLLVRRAVRTGGDFDRSVNPISTRRTDYAHHITTLSPTPPPNFRPSYGPGKYTLMSRADKLSNYIPLVLEKRLTIYLLMGGHLTMNTQTSSKYGTMMWQYVLLTRKSHDS